MKQIFYSIIILLFFTLEVHSSFTDTLHFRVSTAYKELLANPSEITEANFFQAFPDNCNEFVIWKWQFDNSEERKMMNIEEYIERLGQLVTINDSIYCLKLIHLSIGANYDSDGLSFFQHILRDKMHNPKLFGIFIDLLSRPTWTKGEQLRFWMFYWSSLSFIEQGYIPKKTEEDRRPELNLILKRLKHNKDMRKIVRLAYEYSAYQVFFPSSYNLHGYKYMDYLKK